MSVYTSNSVKRAADFVTGPLPGAVKFVAVTYAVGTLGAARFVAPNAVDKWADQVADEVETRQYTDLLDYLTPWTV